MSPHIDPSGNLFLKCMFFLINGAETVDKSGHIDTSARKSELSKAWSFVCNGMLARDSARSTVTNYENKQIERILFTRTGFVYYVRMIDNLCVRVG